MADHVVAVDVIVLEPPAVIDVASVGVQGPPGVAGAPGPAGPVGPAGPAGAPGTGTGDVTGPASATADAIAVFSGTTGKLVKDAVGAAAFGNINALAVGTNPAQSGAIRLANASELRWRNGGNNADVVAFSVDGANNLIVGQYHANPLYLDGSAVNIRAAATIESSVAIGTNPAQSGAVRLANDQAIMARNGANTGDLRVATTYASVIYFGDGVNAIQMLGTVAFASSSTVDFANSQLTIGERTSPAAPAANKANIWLQDNGSGKSQLMIQFNTGAAIAIATQA